MVRACRHRIRSLTFLSALLGVVASTTSAAQGDQPADPHAALAAGIDAMKTQLFDLSDWLYKNPEYGLKELNTTKKMLEPLEAVGFKTRSGLAGFPTGVRSEKPIGTGGPTIAFVPMTDALRGPGDTAFHGCHHNLQVAAAVGAVLTLTRYMEEHALNGTVALISYPAEEIPPPTINDMNAAGVYDDVDFVLEFHSAGTTSRAAGGIGSCCTIPINAVRYTFIGHAVSANVQTRNLKSTREQGSALDAMLQFFENVKQVRQQVKAEAIIQGVIAQGGEAPNVIPGKTVADFFIRYPVDRPYLDKITEAMSAAASRAAEATGTKVQIDVYGKLYVGISVAALEERAFAYEKSFGATNVQEAKGLPKGGMISQWVPGVSISTQTFSAIPGHSLEMADASVAPMAHNGLLVAAKTMAALGYDLVSDTALRQKAVAEHKQWREELGKHGWLEPGRSPGRTSGLPPKNP